MSTLASASGSAFASSSSSSSTSTARRPPPPYFDGRPHFLDASYHRVERFGRKRPGGRESGDGSGVQDEDLDEEDDEGSDHDEDEDEDDDDGSDDSNESEYEYTYEDLPPQLVIFDLGPDSKRLSGNDGSSRGTSNTAQGQWSISGLETDGPMLKVGNVIFRGEWQESIGTGIILEDVRDPTRPFPNQHHPSPLSPPLPSTTHDVIRFRQVINSQSESNEAAVRRLNNKSKFKDEVSQTQTRVRFADDDSEDEEEEKRKRGGRKRLTPMQKTQRAIEKALRADPHEAEAQTQGPIVANRIKRRLDAMQREEDEARRFLLAGEGDMADEGDHAVADQVGDQHGDDDGGDGDDDDEQPAASASPSASASPASETTATRARGRGRGRGRARGRARGSGRGRGRGRGGAATTPLARTRDDASDSDVEMSFDQEVDREAAIRAAQQQQQQQ